MTVGVKHYLACKQQTKFPQAILYNWQYIIMGIHGALLIDLRGFLYTHHMRSFATRRAGHRDKL